MATALATAPGPEAVQRDESLSLHRESQLIHDFGSSHRSSWIIRPTPIWPFLAID
jgi:hypothetical protein